MRSPKRFVGEVLMVEEKEAVGAQGPDKHGSIVRAFYVLLWLCIVAWRELHEQFLPVSRFCHP